ncbi:MAG TPA: HAMP domain-containing histidine kinase [Candidatus Agathobaculum merdigallinarum]|nr:HAMP domain-containing histidine kinase [Candidatus Agathobaculum merdigallinarum]
MKRVESRAYGRVKISRFPLSIFCLVLGGLLLTSGVHVGLIVLMNRLALDDIIQTIVPLVYWIGMSILVTLLIIRMTKNTFEKPVQELAAATRKVAEGDFSVYVPPMHTADQLDYLDAMILDFNKMVAELGSIETLKTDFFSNVSHEIKTPLAVIQNTAQLMRDKNLSDEQRAEYAETIERYARRLADLITNILKLNKLEKQTIQPRPEPYDLCAHLAECALLFERRWEEKGIEFEAEIEDQAIIEADASLLELVWNNLLSNAVKFTEQGGSVILRQTSTAGEVEVSVSDTGCGMDEETLAHIFDKFYQGDTSHATEGNGLGLALVLRILRMMGGSITVSSTQGQGSMFTVRLPVHPAQ